MVANNTMYKQVYQIYDEDLEVGFYLYKNDRGVYHVKGTEIMNSNLLKHDHMYLFVGDEGEYCLLSTFLHELMNISGDYREVDNYKAQDVIENIIDRLCNG